jgi:hypothetical protein
MVENFLAVKKMGALRSGAHVLQVIKFPSGGWFLRISRKKSLSGRDTGYSAKDTSRQM